MGQSEYSKRDIASQIEPDVCIEKSAYSSPGTNLTGNDIDRNPNTGQKYFSVDFFIRVWGGDGGDSLKFKVQEKSAGGSYSDYTDHNGNKKTATIQDQSGEARLQVSEPSKRYLTLFSDSADQTVGTSTNIFALAIRGGARERPA